VGEIGLSESGFKFSVGPKLTQPLIYFWCGVAMRAVI